MTTNPLYRHMAPGFAGRQPDEISRPIPVHGTPITPAHLLDELAGESFCVSYMDPRQGERCAELVGDDGMLLLDNGAFTAWRKGIALDRAHWDRFYDWAGTILGRCDQAIAVIPDVIGGHWRENYELALECPLPDDRMMIVWHLDEPLEILAEYVERFRFIAFGSSGDYAQVGAPAWHARIRAAFDTIDTLFQDPGFAAAYARPNLHMMRGLGQMHAYPFTTADSSNVARNHNRYRGRPGHVAEFAARVNAKALNRAA